MAHLGLICPELSGHLNPMTTLGRELKRRGHRVTLIGRPDAQKKTETAGLEFAVVGEKEFPAGSLAQTTAKLGRLAGLNAIRFTAEFLRRAAVKSWIRGRMPLRVQVSMPCLWIRSHQPERLSRRHFIYHLFRFAMRWR